MSVVAMTMRSLLPDSSFTISLPGLNDINEKNLMKRASEKKGLMGYHIIISVKHNFWELS